MPERIQMSRQHPWRAKHPDAVLVARPTIWGNPFRAGFRSTIQDRDGRREVIVATIAEAVELYQRWILLDLDLLPAVKRPTMRQVYRELAGHDLACWCAPASSCHADVLLKLANGPADE